LQAPAQQTTATGSRALRRARRWQLVTQSSSFRTVRRCLSCGRTLVRMMSFLHRRVSAERAPPPRGKGPLVVEVIWGRWPYPRPDRRRTLTT
jgi:hypothetical protein